MGLYKLILSKQVRKKDLPKLPVKDRKRILEKIDSLQYEPRPAQIKKLSKREEYCWRQGGYRILYIIEDEVKIVEIRKVRPRGEVYK